MPKSFLDHAFDFISGQSNPVSFKDLWNYIVKASELSEEEANDKVARFYTNLILQNENWNFCGIYADDGISGTSTTYRNQFNQMLDKARAKQIDIILVKSISRFARNIVDLLETVRELRLLGVEVIFEREGLSTLDTKCDQMLTCYAKFAEEEAISMSKNVKWRYERNKEKGIYHLPVNLLGYKTINGCYNGVQSIMNNVHEAPTEEI